MHLLVVELSKKLTSFEAYRLSIHNSLDGWTSIPLMSPDSVGPCTFRRREAKPFSSSHGETIFDEDEGETASVSSSCPEDEVSTLLNRDK